MLVFIILIWFLTLKNEHFSFTEFFTPGKPHLGMCEQWLLYCQWGASHHWMSMSTVSKWIRLRAMNYLLNWVEQWISLWIQLEHSFAETIQMIQKAFGDDAKSVSSHQVTPKNPEFAVAIKPLAIALREKVNIKGFYLCGWLW